MTDETQVLPIVGDKEMQTAQMLAASEFVPSAYRNKPQNIIAAALHGRELGLNVMQALKSIAVINGNPSIYGDAALAVCSGHPDFEDIDETLEGEGDTRCACCVVKRKGRTPVEREFSVADAKRAKLWGKQGPWTQYPDRMLQLRARGFALRDSFPDALNGLELAEVVQDYAPASGEFPPPMPAVKPPKGVEAAVSRSQTLRQALTQAPGSEDDPAEVVPAGPTPQNGPSEPQEPPQAQQAQPGDGPGAPPSTDLRVELDTMIEKVKACDSLEALTALLEPCKELREKLGAAWKGQLSKAYNQRSSELSGTYRTGELG